MVLSHVVGSSAAIGATSSGTAPAKAEAGAVRLLVTDPLYAKRAEGRTGAAV